MVELSGGSNLFLKRNRLPALTAYKPREEIEESPRGVERLFLPRVGICTALWWEHSAEAKCRIEVFVYC